MQVFYKTPEKPLDAHWTIDYVVLEYSDANKTTIKSIVATTPKEDLANLIVNELPEYRKHVAAFRIY